MEINKNNLELTKNISIKTSQTLIGSNDPQFKRIHHNFHHIVLYIKDYIMKEKCKNYLEIGTHYGHSMCNMLQSNYNTKYMGICKLVSRSKGRRIDIRFIPYRSRASALLYFTGSGVFNKAMRLHAKKKGYLINEYGLYKVSKEGGHELIETETEEDIFKILDLKYKLPKERNSVLFH